MTEREIIEQVLIRTHKPCPKCGEVKLYILNNRPRMATCGHGHQIAILKGTMADHSHTPLAKWIEAIRLVKAGCTALKLATTINVTYKCAWRMTKLIRSSNLDPLVGIALNKRYRGPKTLEEAELRSLNKL